MKKKGIIISLIVVIVLLIILGIIIYPKYLEEKNIESLDKEISLVNSYLNGKEDYEKINNYLKEDITSGNLKNVEESIENYLNDLLKEYSELQKSMSSNISLNAINSDTIDKLKKIKEDISINKEKINDILTKKNEYLKNNEYKELYQELINKINFNSEDLFNKANEILDNNIKIIDFLNKNNKSWKIEEDKIIFSKRNIFNLYKEMNNDLFKYELVNDKEGPIITASDITIYKGDKINIKDKVKCNDLVDDTIECMIEGNFDINKIGLYNIKINATDLSNNKSSKTIKLNVKEKVKKPYYIEVIRNQNIVIVYGLDSNNEYKKIIKVFTCSTGKTAGATPVGTFTTTKGYAWGSLFGGVYGQYSTRIVGNILFHSVPYYKKDKSTLEWEEYNKLGSPASMGCIRLAVGDVKWIFDNCPVGTTVKIYDGNIPNGVVKPTPIRIDGTSPNRGWDPTDPDKNNPWNK